jgi:hypothetical protein
MTELQENILVRHCNLKAPLKAFASIAHRAADRRAFTFE